MANNIINADGSNFNDVVEKSAVPVLVDFWAPWCGPCRALAPVIEQVTAKYNGKIKVAKVNVDEEPSLASKFRIMSIPTLILFKDGTIVNQAIGFRPAQDLEKMIDNIL